MPSISGDGLNERQLLLTGIASTCVVLSTLAIALRLVVRWSSTAILWWDDWVAMFALVVSWLPNILTIVGIKYGLGRCVFQVKEIDMISFGVIVFVQQITWGLSIGLIIFSILLFYFRIFPHTWMPKAVYIVGTWDAVWTICTLIVTVNQCIPIHFIWNHEPHNAKCININAFYFASGMISTLTILTALFLPLPIICKLQVSGTKKVGLGISFTVGAFTCVASVIRMIVVLRTDAEDLTYSLTYPALWSCVEVSFGVISACLPSLTTLFLTLLGKKPRNSRRRSLYSSRHRDAMTRNGELSHNADTARAHVVSPDPATDTGPYYLMDDLTCAHETEGSIFVTHRVDQVASKETDHTAPAAEVEVVADSSAWIECPAPEK